MNKGSGVSNSMTLFHWICSMEGETFAEKSANAVKELDTRMSLSGRDSAKWQRLLRTKGLVEGLIRFDRVEIPFEGEISESALAA